MNSNFSEIRQLIFGISSSTQDLFGEEPYINTFTDYPKEENAHLQEILIPPEKTIVVVHKSKIYVFMIIFLNELLQNISFPESFCRCVMNELKYFLMFQEKKLNVKPLSKNNCICMYFKNIHFIFFLVCSRVEKLIGESGSQNRILFNNYKEY